jgi:hypothetical protein
MESLESVALSGASSTVLAKKKFSSFGLRSRCMTPKSVAPLHNPDDGIDELCDLTLAVVALGDDVVEKLTTGTELHADVDEDHVLVGASDANDIWVLGEVVHDLDLIVHVLVVLAAQQLVLGD